MSMNTRFFLILILAVIVSPMAISHASSADEHSLHTLGDEFLVNIGKPKNLRSYTVAPLNGGGFVVVWSFFDGPFAYNCNACVKGQLFDKNGIKGNEFTIAGQDSRSAMGNNVVEVAALDDGFIVVWEINMHSTQDIVSSGQDIVGQRYDSAGAKQGDTFFVNTSREKNQTEPNVVSLANGGFIAVWKHRAGKDRSIRGQRFTETGDMEGEEFVIHDATVYMSLPDIASFTDGGFVVAWQSRDDDNHQKAFARRYDTQGNATGEKFRLTTMIKGKEGNVNVTTFANGHFMATWDSADQPGPGRRDIYGRIFDTADTPTGDKFQINQHTAEDQKNPEITSLGDDRAFIVWESAEQDGEGYGVFGRFYTNKGVPDGDELQINGYSRHNQDSPEVSNLSDGSVVVVWRSEAGNYSGGGSGRKIKEHQPHADHEH